MAEGKGGPRVVRVALEPGDRVEIKVRGRGRGGDDGEPLRLRAVEARLWASNEERLRLRAEVARLRASRDETARKLASALAERDREHERAEAALAAAGAPDPTADGPEPSVAVYEWMVADWGLGLGRTSTADVFAALYAVTGRGSHPMAITQDALSKISRSSPRNVRRACASLRALGLIETEAVETELPDGRVLPGPLAYSIRPESVEAAVAAARGRSVWDAL